MSDPGSSSGMLKSQLVKLKQSNPTKKEKIQCVVIGCGNRREEAKGIEFYSFPQECKLSYKKDKRKEWLNALAFQEGKWRLKPRSRICSAHFIGNQKSEDPRSPAYVPCIFPGIPLNFNPDEAMARYKRSVELLREKCVAEARRREQEEEEERLDKQVIEKEAARRKACRQSRLGPPRVPFDVRKVVTVATNAYFPDPDVNRKSEKMFVFVCNRYENGDVETQACDSVYSRFVDNFSKMKPGIRDDPKKIVITCNVESEIFRPKKAKLVTPTEVVYVKDESVDIFDEPCGSAGFEGS